MANRSSKPDICCEDLNNSLNGTVIIMYEVQITSEGLLAGERYLREHIEEYNDGTREGFHVDFIEDVVSQALRASRVEFLMPCEPQKEPLRNSS